MIWTRRLAVIALALAAAACGVPAGNAGDLHGFTSDKKQNLFGYYLPSKELRFGKYVLNNISLGEPSDFTTFESGKRISPQYASVLLNFDDTSSPKKQGELGEYYSNAPRVLPTAYRATGGTLVFIGNNKQMGVIVFEGKFDLAAVHDVQNGGIDKTVMTGDITVGTKTVKGVTFTWFGGD